MWQPLSPPVGIPTTARRHGDATAPKPAPKSTVEPARTAGPTDASGSALARVFRDGRSRSAVVPSSVPATPFASPKAPNAGSAHPLADAGANHRLAAYEFAVKGAFDAIEPALRRIAASADREDFVTAARAIAQEALGLDLPALLLERAWVDGLDMRALFAWAVFETARRFADDFFAADPLGGANNAAFDAFLHDCGFHTLDISPCADGRLAHVVSYVLRLPHGSVRRRSHAGSLFDIEDTVRKWVEVEMHRYREGLPTPAHRPTRYLKAVVYHTSGSAPETEGCAAHGSDVTAAARAGLERLNGFRTAIESGFCCGAAIDLLLIGLDTDSDAIRLHLPDRSGRIDLDRFLDAADFYAETGRDGLLAGGDAETAARAWIMRQVGAGAPAEGMVRLAARLLAGNLSQMDYVATQHGGRYADIGHAERFIGMGIGFEEIQLRNLTYFAYLDTVEEGAPDLDVGVKVLGGLNGPRGLPVPVVIRFDYHGTVPGARDRAVARARRTETAMLARYADKVASGHLHTVLMVRDCAPGARVEVIGGTVHDAVLGQGGGKGH
jgi:carboxysome shell carbonic anhydrase